MDFAWGHHVHTENERIGVSSLTIYCGLQIVSTSFSLVHWFSQTVMSCGNCDGRFSSSDDNRRCNHLVLPEPVPKPDTHNKKETEKWSKTSFRLTKKFLFSSFWGSCGSWFCTFFAGSLFIVLVYTVFSRGLLDSQCRVSGGFQSQRCHNCMHFSSNSFVITHFPSPRPLRNTRPVRRSTEFQGFSFNACTHFSPRFFFIAHFPLNFHRFSTIFLLNFSIYFPEKLQKFPHERLIVKYRIFSGVIVFLQGGP